MQSFTSRELVVAAWRKSHGSCCSHIGVVRTICKKRNHGNLKESGADQDPLNKVEISILEFKCISSKFSRRTSSRFIFREYSENHSGWSEDKKHWCCLEVGSTGTQRISPDPSRTSRTTVAPVAWGSPRPMALHGSAWLCMALHGSARWIEGVIHSTARTETGPQSSNCPKGFGAMELHSCHLLMTARSFGGMATWSHL